MDKLAVANQLTDAFADRGCKVWSKDNPGGSPKIVRVYIGSHSKPSYCEIKDDVVLIGSLNGHEYQAVMEYLAAEAIPYRRF